MSKTNLAARICVVCRATGAPAVGSETTLHSIRRKKVALCARHAALAGEYPTVEALVVAMIGERRATDRRATRIDRRAFWRPTPDRRRETTERGRRGVDRPVEA
jgi:hypothetical protein